MQKDREQRTKAFRERMSKLQQYRKDNPGSGYIEWKTLQNDKSLDAITGQPVIDQPVRKFDNTNSTFDVQKVYDRVPARAWAPAKPTNRLVSGPLSAVGYYMFGDDDTAQRYVNDAKMAIRDPKYKNQPYRIKDAISYLAHEDAKDFYLGMPQRTGLIEESPHKPSVSTSDDQYYRFKHQTPQYWEDTVTDLLYDKQKSSSKRYSDTTLSTYKASIGTDPLYGEYVSIYDQWDYNTDVIGKPGDNVGKYVGGQPFEIYDRIYLDDLYNVDSAPESGDFYGGYLPELKVTANKK